MGFDLQSLTNLSPINALIDVAADAIGLPPEIKAIAKVGIGFVTSNPVVMLDGALELGEAAKKTAETEWKTSSDPARASDGYAKPAEARGGGSAIECEPGAQRHVAGSASTGTYATGTVGGVTTSGVSTREAAYYQHARTLLDNFDKIETAGWLKVRDGGLTPADLEAVRGNPDVPREIREAADYFLKHPKQYAKFSTPSGMVDRAKLAAVVLEGERLGVYEGRSCGSGNGSVGGAHRGNGAHSNWWPTQPPAGIAVGGCHPQRNPVRDILNDRSMSPSDKLEAILFAIADGADREALEIAEQISDLQDRQAGIDRSSKEGQVEAQNLQQSIDRLSQRLQKLMERRTQMMQLISNINKAMHENAMLCISNIR